MRDIFLRMLTDDERNTLYEMIQDEDDDESSYHAIPRSSYSRMKDTLYQKGSNQPS